MSNTVAAAGMAVSVVPAYIQPITLPLPPIIFPFSPSKFTLGAKANVVTNRQSSTMSGEGSPTYAGRDPAKLDVEIHMDQFAIPPIPIQLTVLELNALLSPNPITFAAGMPDAPQVMFGWGPNIIMEQACVIAVSVTYERFLLGMPIQAVAKVTLQTIPSLLPMTNPTSGGLATRRTYTTVEGDNLALVAYREYGDPNKWRAIAVINDIDDPMRVKPGTELLIPEKREADVLAA